MTMDCQDLTRVSHMEYVKCRFELRSCDSHTNVVADMAILHLLEQHPHQLHTKAPELFQQVMEGCDAYETKKLIQKDPEKWRKLSNYLSEMKRIANGL